MSKQHVYVFEELYEIPPLVYWNRYTEKYVCDKNSDEDTVRDCSETNKCWELFLKVYDQPIQLTGAFKNATSMVGHAVNDVLEECKQSLLEQGYTNVEVIYG